MSASLVGITSVYHYTHMFYYGSKDKNSRPRVCKASVLLADVSPKPNLLVFVKLSPLFKSRRGIWFRVVRHSRKCFQLYDEMEVIFFCFFGERECSTWTRGHLLEAWGTRSRWLSDFRASLWLLWFHQDVVFLVIASSALPMNTQRQAGSLCLYPGPIKDRGCSWERQNKAIFYNNYSGWARKLTRKKKYYPIGEKEICGLVAQKHDRFFFW